MPFSRRRTEKRRQIGLFSEPFDRPNPEDRIVVEESHLLPYKPLAHFNTTARHDRFRKRPPAFPASRHSLCATL